MSLITRWKTRIDPLLKRLRRTPGRAFAIAIGSGIGLFAVLQVVRPGIPAKPAAAELQAPAAVRHVLEKDCYSCHSDRRQLSWFDRIVPVYWMVRHDVLTARERLDFSTLGSQPAAAQKAALYEAVNMIQLGAMPLPEFVRLHPESRVTPEELSILKTYLSPWKAAPGQPDASPGSNNPKSDASALANSRQPFAPLSLAAVPRELNGLPFDPEFENWRPISTTERGDNDTLRMILGNDIAVTAAESGRVSPWPDGTRLAKVAWQREAGPDGLVYPGKFVQVELMVKDARLYKRSDGWGWGRWRGQDLKPYGKDARFVNECTGCHQPVKGNDYVYTLPISGAILRGQEVVNNNAAALPVDLPYLPETPTKWGAITTFVDPAARTTATLYGGGIALTAVDARIVFSGGNPSAQSYPLDAVLALVTWKQRDDPHWFGGRIPDLPLSVEFVQVAAPGQVSQYRRFAGPRLDEDLSTAGIAKQRTDFILGLRPAPLP